MMIKDSFQEDLSTVFGEAAANYKGSLAKD